MVRFFPSLSPFSAIKTDKGECDGSKAAVRNCFIRGSVIRYVQLPKNAVDTQLLEDATRRGEFATP